MKMAAWRSNNRAKDAAISGLTRVLAAGWTIPEGTTRQEIIAAVLPIYEDAQRLTAETGVEHHVDHIIPIGAGGPHTPDNLRAVPAEVNRKKIGPDKRQIKQARLNASSHH